MALVSSTEMLKKARKEGYAVVAFNVHTLEMLQAVVEAAHELKAPLIIQTTVGTVKHLGAEYIVAAVKAAAQKFNHPIALHLDHCSDLNMILHCMRVGYTSVMIDYSLKPFAENVEMTKKVVELAQVLEVNVEAELGKIAGIEDDIVVDDKASTLADPQECKLFVEQTGVHTLAPAIGTAHGIYKGEPKIDFARLAEIAKLVDVPLVLHGGSGLSASILQQGIASGIAKINVATELRNMFSETIKQAMTDRPDDLDPRSYMALAKQNVKQLAITKIKMAYSENRL